VYKYLTTTFLIFTALLLGGCGYHMGVYGNPQIKTIAIAPITNDTSQIGASTHMKQALADRFQFDGTYKITNMNTADAILYGRISGIDVTAPSILTADDGVTFMTKEYQIEVTFEYSLVIPGNTTPVVPQTEVSESSQFQVPVDLFPARESGISQACRKIAENVAWRCSEGW
jgi:outer membrane lipopolysaccharide assembly protein LptE/RlpB